jgi:hypothetical protein
MSKMIDRELHLIDWAKSWGFKVSVKRSQWRLKDRQGNIFGPWLSALAQCFMQGIVWAAVTWPATRSFKDVEDIAPGRTLYAIRNNLHVAEICRAEPLLCQGEKK